MIVLSVLFVQCARDDDDMSALLNEIISSLTVNSSLTLLKSFNQGTSTSGMLHRDLPLSLVHLFLQISHSSSSSSCGGAVKTWFTCVP